MRRRPADDLSEGWHALRYSAGRRPLVINHRNRHRHHPEGILDPKYQNCDTTPVQIKPLELILALGAASKWIARTKALPGFGNFLAAWTSYVHEGRFFSSPSAGSYARPAAGQRRQTASGCRRRIAGICRSAEGFRREPQAPEGRTAGARSTVFREIALLGWRLCRHDTGVRQCAPCWRQLLV
jgi:hypothetical protein